MVVIHDETRDSIIFERLHGPGVHLIGNLGNAVSALCAMIADGLLVIIPLCFPCSLESDYGK